MEMGWGKQNYAKNVQLVKAYDGACFQAIELFFFLLFFPLLLLFSLFVLFTYTHLRHVFSLSTRPAIHGVFKRWVYFALTFVVAFHVLSWKRENLYTRSVFQHLCEFIWQTLLDLLLNFCLCMSERKRQKIQNFIS